MVYGWYIMRESKSKTAILSGWRLWTVLLQRWRSLLWFSRVVSTRSRNLFITQMRDPQFWSNWACTWRGPNQAETMVMQLWLVNGYELAMANHKRYNRWLCTALWIQGSFPGRFCLQFLITYSMQKQRWEGLGERVTCVMSARCDGGSARSL